jgi:two-component system nitrogen regulation response regulator GlnG/two-component system response regulator HydG
MTTLAGTITGGSLPWDVPPAGGAQTVLHLVLAWSLDEPERVGDVCPLGSPLVLGRGEAQVGDRYPRATWFRQRGPWSEERAPLGSRRISRSQLELRPTGAGRLLVRRVGQCALLQDGQTQDELELGAGDVFTLRNAAVFLLIERPLRPRGAPQADLHAFGETDLDGFVGESDALWFLRERIALAAESPHHVLVAGASGTGKELVARAVHRRSSRAGGPFVSRNAATIPEGIVDAELFGCARGYPNAGSPERTGLVAEADGGSLFLDEVGELPHPVQAHLLRVLDRGGEYQRLGETRARTSDFRCIAATNRPLQALKHDLAARFASRLVTPGLEERREDIPLLMRALLRRFQGETPRALARFVSTTGGHEVFRSDPRLTELLLRRTYTTHLRELERLLWSAVEESAGDYLECPRELEATANMEDPVVESTDAEALEVASEELTADDVRRALEETRGSITHAARRLGLRNRYVLYRVMKRLGVGAP